MKPPLVVVRPTGALSKPLACGPGCHAPLLSVARHPPGAIALRERYCDLDRGFEISFHVLEGDRATKEVRPHELGESRRRLVVAAGCSNVPGQRTVDVVDEPFEVMRDSGVVVPHSVLIQ